MTVEERGKRCRFWCEVPGVRLSHEIHTRIHTQRICVHVYTLEQRDFISHVWKHLVPEDTICFYIAITDGAGCYSGLHQLLSRIDLSRRTGIYIKEYLIPET